MKFFDIAVPYRILPKQVIPVYIPSLRCVEIFSYRKSKLDYYQLLQTDRQLPSMYIHRLREREYAILDIDSHHREKERELLRVEYKLLIFRIFSDFVFFSIAQHTFICEVDAHEIKLALPCSKDGERLIPTNCVAGRPLLSYYQSYDFQPHHKLY